MAQTKKKTAMKTKKKMAAGQGMRRQNKTQTEEQSSNMFFVISMSVLATSLLIADLLMIVS